MFTGIVEELGTVTRFEPRGDTVRLGINARTVREGSDVGASLAVNGVCLTVVEHLPDGLTFEIGPETLQRTALRALRAGHPVNLERPLRFGGALGGHLVLGHVDGVATVERVQRVESTARIRIALRDRDLAPLLIPQGSVAVDGVSLTIAGLGGSVFDVMIIPFTWAHTALSDLRPSAQVNLECDMVGKYVARAAQWYRL